MSLSYGHFSLQSSAFCSKFHHKEFCWLFHLKLKWLPWYYIWTAFVIICFECVFFFLLLLFFSPHHAISVFNFSPNMLKLSCSVLLLSPTLHSPIPVAPPVPNGGSSGQAGWCNPRSEEPCSGLHRQSAQWHTQSAGTGSERANSSHRSKLSSLRLGSKSNGRDGMRTFKYHSHYF